MKSDNEMKDKDILEEPSTSDESLLQVVSSEESREREGR
jgi:hypothetical protein